MFKHPCTAVVSGATGSGKTHWVARFLESYEQLMEPAPKRVLYAYGELNPTIMNLGTHPNIELYAGVPDEQTLLAARDENGRLLLILDDLMLNISKNYMDTLFTKGSHNWNVSVFYVCQHLFTPELRVARQNAHYIILMRNPSGALQIRNLAAQLFPTRTAYFLDAYTDATSEQFSYLIVDLHPKTPDNLRLRSYIYPEDVQIIYIPR
jgi:hypothetical protein